MARKRARSSATDEPQAPTVPTATPLRRSNRSTRATQSFRDITGDEDESQKVVKRQRKADKQTQMSRHNTAAEQSPSAAGYNTRSKQIQSPEMNGDIASDEDEADIEELPTWPRYKDDLPNAFNGEVDPSQDFISKAPVEIIDNILSFMLLDHDPERGIKIKEGTYKARSHVLISMAAMSRLFYHATEGFAYKFLTKNKEDLTRPFVSTWDLEHPELHQAILARAEEYRQERVEQLSKVRRSSRLASKPQPQAVKVHRMELVRVLQSRCAACFDAAWTQGKFANTVSVCGKCEWSINGQTETLTEALRNYDLRDYMLLKTRKPGPRAKFTNLPTITSASEFKALGFPAFRNMTVFSFRSKDLRMLADLVHGDWRQHMAKKWQERASRQDKARTKRVRQFIIQYHERELEVSQGREAKRHQKRLDKLRSIPLDEKEDGLTGHFGCTKHFCYHDIGLCSTCGDVPGRDTEECPECDAAWMYRRFEQFYGRSLAQSGSGNQGA